MSATAATSATARPTRWARPGTSNSLFDYVLDVGHDDYYGHSGSWWDVQDSAWLSHLNAPQFGLTVDAAATGTVTSDLPGIACPPACSIAWDSGTTVTLDGGDRTAAGQQFAGWSGACTGRDAAEVTMDAAKIRSTATVRPARPSHRRRSAGRLGADAARR